MTTPRPQTKFLKSILLYLLIVLIGKPLMQILSATLGSLLNSQQSNIWLTTIYLFTFIILILGVIIIVKWVEKRSLKELDLTTNNDTPQKYIRYILLGFCIVAITLLIMQFTGIYQFTGFGQINPIYLIVTLIAYIVQASAEELLIRGYLHHRICEAKGFYWGLAFNTFFFTLPHILSIENIMNLQVLVIVINLILISIIFTLIMTINQSLWTAMGLHIGWNYTLGSIFGVAVSGLEASNSLMNFKINTTNVLLSGGTYGIEGSILLIPILSAMIIYYLHIIKQRKVTLDGI